jgi:hypothetical protein
MILIRHANSLCPHMIVRCPSCSSRAELPSAKLEGGNPMINCGVCGHSWIEGRAVEIIRDVSPQLPALSDPVYEPEHEIRRLVDASRQAQEAFLNRRKRRRRLAASWVCLFGLATSPAAFALAFPETTVGMAPASIALYDWMGREVNLYGLDIRKVETQHLLVDGQRIIAIKGEIANVSGSQRKIPWLRFGLRDAKGAEVYTWQLDTKARPLDALETTNFVTRVASPPESSGKIEIRFARIEEIGSNAAP